MEIIITAYFTNDLAPMDFSASVMEIGHNAGPDTWQAAIEESADLVLLDTPEKIQALKDYSISAGMEQEEIQAMSDIESNALFIQWISGDIREANEYLEQSPIDWAGYEADKNTCGRMFKGIDNEIYYYLGS